MEYEPQVDEYILLFRLETKLRQLVESRLSAISNNPWDDCVPWLVREKVKGNIEKKEKAPWFRRDLNRRLREWYYLNLSDYKYIILNEEKGNWAKVFKKIFVKAEEEKDADAVAAFVADRLDALQQLRNNVMHHDQLTSDQEAKLFKYSEEIISRIEKWTDTNEQYYYPALDNLQKENTEKAIEILNDGLNHTITEDKPKGDPYLAYLLGRVFEARRNTDQAREWYGYAATTLPLPEYRNQAEEHLREVERKVELVSCPECGHRFQA